MFDQVEVLMEKKSLYVVMLLLPLLNFYVTLIYFSFVICVSILNSSFHVMVLLVTINKIAIFLVSVCSKLVINK